MNDIVTCSLISNSVFCQIGNQILKPVCPRPFEDFVRFIGNDFTPHESEEATEASVECCVKQSIIGDYAINTYLSMPKSAAVVFASRYVGDTFEEYDEDVQASLEDFLKLDKLKPLSSSYTQVDNSAAETVETEVADDETNNKEQTLEQEVTDENENTN